MYFRKALDLFRSTEVSAEMARTELELALVLMEQARLHIHQTEGSREWKLGLRVLSTLRTLRILAPRETLATAFVALVALALWRKR